MAGIWLWTLCWGRHTETLILRNYPTLINTDDFNVIIINVYGYSSKSENDSLLETLENKIQQTLNNFPYSGLVVGGDFNMILDHNIDCWPSRDQSSVNNNLKMFMQNLNLIDIWRNNNPNTSAFTWRNRNTTIRSCIDFWLVSQNMNVYLISVNIITAPLTDHNAVSISVSLCSNNFKICRSTYWKLNSSLLQHKTVKIEIEKLMN